MYTILETVYWTSSTKPNIKQIRQCFAKLINLLTTKMIYQNEIQMSKTYMSVSIVQ